MDFAVRRAEEPVGTVLRVHGELDIATVAVLREVVTAALSDGPRRVLLDLTATSFVDSTGCRELFRAARAGGRSGVPVALVVPPENWRVRKVLDFMQFGEALPVHDAMPPA